MRVEKLNLSRFYQEFFELRKIDKIWDSLSPILDVLCASQIPLPVSHLYYALLMTTPQLTKLQFNTALTHLRPFLRYNESAEDSMISIYHKSFADWLLTSANDPNVNFHIDRELGYRRIAVSILVGLADGDERVVDLVLQRAGIVVRGRIGGLVCEREMRQSMSGYVSFHQRSNLMVAIDFEIELETCNRTVIRRVGD